MTNQSLIRHELLQASDVLDAFISSNENLSKVEEAAVMLSESFKNGGKVISCGNGGSHCDAMHFAEELTGRFRDNRKPLPAMAISDPSYISCTANDYGYNYIFSRYIEAFANEGDVIFVLSTSGNSKNIVNAVKAAKKKKAKVIALTGNTGGTLAEDGIVDLEIRVPHDGYSDRIQELHIKIIHIIILLIEKLM